MLRATFRSLLAHKLRLLLSALAVVIGVAFVSGTLAFTNTLDHTFTDLFNGTLPDVTVTQKSEFATNVTQLSGQTGRIPDSAVTTVRGVNGVDRATGSVEVYGVFLLDRHGDLIGGQGAPGIAVNWVDNYPGMRLVEGRAPARDDEIVIDTVTAKKGGFRVGDTVTVLSPGPRLREKIVGLMKYGETGSLAGASLTAFTDKVAQNTLLGGPGTWTGIAVMGRDGVTDTQLRDRVSAALGPAYRVDTKEQTVSESTKQIEQGLGFVRTFLLVFAGIALFVGTFIILNTFAMLVAQRTRELALLRAVGATRRQVSSSILGEALVVGLVGATLGLFGGLGLAYGLKAVFGAIGLELRSGLIVTPSVVAWSYAVGVPVTLVAAYLPARRASRIPPVAALRADIRLPERSLRVRAIAGGVAVLAGIGAMLAGLAGSGRVAAVTVGVGAALMVIAAITLSPVVSRPFITVVGFFLPRVFGTVGALAEDNARRNPRRTAATSSALMIALAIVATFGIVGASAKSSVDKMIDRSLGADFVISNSVGTSFSPELGDKVAAVPGIERVYRIRATITQVEGKPTSVAAYDPGLLQNALRVTWVAGSDAGLAGDGLVVDQRVAEGKGWQVGTRVPVAFQYGGARTLTVSGIYESNPAIGAYGIGLKTYDATTKTKPQDMALFATRAPGSDTARVKSAVREVVSAYPIAKLTDQTEFKAEQRKQIDQLLVIIYALAALAVIIAVLGIVNTLALSVIERTREIGLLRAVGLSKRGLKRMIRLESLVISIYGALLGLVLGLVFGVALQRAARNEGIESLSIPIGQVVVFFLLASLIGVLAAVWPARRAARLDILNAIGAAE